MAKAKKDVFVKFRGKDKISKKLEKIQGKLARFQKKAEKIGKSFTKNLTLPIAGVGAGFTKLALDLNSQMGDVQTVLGGTLEESTKRALELKETVKATAAETGLATADIANGAYNVVSAFGDLKGETEGIVLTMSQMAKAGGSTVAEALSLTSAVTKAYGDTSAKAQKQVANLAFQAVKDGQTTFPELAASIGEVTGSSELLGVSQKELFAIFSTTTGIIGKASKVSTQYKAAMQAIMTPTQSMNDVFTKYNVKTGKDFIKVSGGIQGALARIVSASEKTNRPLKDFIGSAEGSNFAIILAGKQADVYKQKLGNMENATTALNDAFLKKTQGIDKDGAAMKRLISQIKNVATTIGDNLIPVFSDLLGNYVKPLAEWFSGLSQRALKYGIAMAGVVASVGPVIIVFSKLIGVVKTLITFVNFLRKAWIAQKIAMVASKIATVAMTVATTALNLVMAVNPFVLIGLAIAGVIAGIVLLIKNFDKVIALAGKVKKAISGFFGGDDEKEIAVNNSPGIKKIENTFKAANARNTVNTNNAAVTVDFNNAPQGTRIETKKDKDAQLNTSLGFAMGI